MKYLLLMFLIPTLALAENLNPLDFKLSGNAVVENGSIALTKIPPPNYWPSLRNQAGEAFYYSQLCAKEYTLSFEANLGSKNYADGGGAGFVFSEVKPDSSLGSVLEFNTGDRYNPDSIGLVELFNYSHYNHLESIATFRPTAMTGWHQIQIHINETKVATDMTGPTGLKFSLSNGREYKPNTPVNFKFNAWTGAYQEAEMSIRNISLNVARADCGAVNLPPKEAPKDPTDNKKVTLCHKGKTILVSKNAVKAHLAHGDYLGVCLVRR